MTKNNTQDSAADSTPETVDEDHLLDPYPADERAEMANLEGNPG